MVYFMTILFRQLTVRVFAVYNNMKINMLRKLFCIFLTQVFFLQICGPVYAAEGKIFFPAQRAYLSPSLQIQTSSLREFVGKTAAQGPAPERVFFFGAGKFRKQDIGENDAEYRLFQEHLEKAEAGTLEAKVRFLISEYPEIFNRWFNRNSRHLEDRLDIFRDRKIIGFLAKDRFSVERTVADIHFKDAYGLKTASIITRRTTLHSPRKEKKIVLSPVSSAEKKELALRLLCEADRQLKLNPRMASMLRFLSGRMNVSLSVPENVNGHEEQGNAAFIYYHKKGAEKTIILPLVPLAGHKLRAKNFKVDFADVVRPRDSGRDITLLAAALAHEIGHAFFRLDNTILSQIPLSADKEIARLYAERFEIFRFERPETKYRILEFAKIARFQKKLDLMEKFGQKKDYSSEEILSEFLTLRSFDGAEEFMAEYLAAFLLDPDVLKEKDPLMSEFISSLLEWEKVLGPETEQERGARTEQIRFLLKKIKQEKRSPGTVKLPQRAVMSDFHGEIDLFLKYTADSISRKIGRKIVFDHKLFPEVSIREQLESQHAGLPELYNAGVRFNLLGDFSDRGRYGIKCFLATQELRSLGLARVVTGNHDFIQLLAAMGYHLPVYKGYDLHGHTESQELVAGHWNDADISADRFSWWQARLSEYVQEQKELQSEFLTIDGAPKYIKDIRAELKSIYLRIKDDLDDEEKELWEDLSGLFFGKTDVYTGFNAIGLMSAQWWEEHRERVEECRERAGKRVRWQGGHEEWSHELNLWRELYEYTREAEKLVKRRLSQKKSEGKWWWQVFNDINHENYTSVQWYGQDWIFHAGWGTNVIKELNEMETDGNITWTAENFMKNKYIQAFAGFSRRNFTLFIRDEYGHYYTHGWLPVSLETGQIGFSYKRVYYRGENIWAGLKKIQEDIRNPENSFAELQEAFELVMSWYADKTVRIKPQHIKEYLDVFGISHIQGGIGARIWFTCHNPLNTLLPKGVHFKEEENGYAHFSVDKGMSWEKFKDVGGYVVSGNGVKIRGFNGPDFFRIIDHPRTLTIGQSEDGTWQVVSQWENRPMSKKEFLDVSQLQLEEELRELTQSKGRLPDVFETAAGVKEQRDFSLPGFQLVEQAI